MLPVCQSTCGKITWKKKQKTKRDNNYCWCQLFCCTVKQQNVFLFHHWNPHMHFYLLRLSKSVQWRKLFVMSHGATILVVSNYFSWHVRGPTNWGPNLLFPEVFYWRCNNASLTWLWGGSGNLHLHAWPKKGAQQYDLKWSVEIKKNKKTRQLLTHSARQ